MNNNIGCIEIRVRRYRIYWWYTLNNNMGCIEIRLLEYREICNYQLKIT